MHLAQLIYISKASNPDTLDLGDLIRHSQCNNGQRNITGALFYAGGNFLQLLEGDDEEISAVFDKIAADPRHSGVQRLLLKRVAKRMFPIWKMELVDLDREQKLDRERMLRLIRDVADRHDTGSLGVEARMLIGDFKQQMVAWAA
jgi:hypothetical protein